MGRIDGLCPGEDRVDADRVSNPRDLQLLLLLLTQVSQEDRTPVLTSLRVNSLIFALKQTWEFQDGDVVACTQTSCHQNLKVDSGSTAIPLVQPLSFLVLAVAAF